MTKIVVDIPTKYDKMIGHLKAEKETNSKSVVITHIVKIFFDKNIEYE